MSDSARTPEELETLFEDALLLRDDVALRELFQEGSALEACDAGTARGGSEIARLALAMWRDDTTYVANPRCVVQVRDLALIIAGQSINVARRDQDGIWRYAIVFVERHNGSKGDFHDTRNDTG